MSFLNEAGLESFIDKLNKRQVRGKGLSKENFTTALKEKLEGLSNYNDAEVQSKLQTLTNNFNTLLNANPDQAINSFNEIIKFLENIEDSESLDSIIAGIEQSIPKIKIFNTDTSEHIQELIDYVNVNSVYDIPVFILWAESSEHTRFLKVVLKRDNELHTEALIDKSGMTYYVKVDTQTKTVTKVTKYIDGRTLLSNSVSLGTLTTDVQKKINSIPDIKIFELSDTDNSSLVTYIEQNGINNVYVSFTDPVNSQFRVLKITKNNPIASETYINIGNEIKALLITQTGYSIQHKTLSVNSLAPNSIPQSKLNQELSDKIDSIPTKTSELENDSDFAYLDDLSNVLAEEIVDETTLPEIETLTREDLKKDLFIDLWNKACGIWGQYNEQTKYFELNGLTDITYDQAVAIYNAGPINNNNNVSRYQNSTIRTNLPPSSVFGYRGTPSGAAFDARCMFRAAKDIEVINFVPRLGPIINVVNSNEIFYSGCPKVHTIIGYIVVGPNTDFVNCPNLVNINLYIVDKDTIKLQGCPKISLESFQWMVTHLYDTVTTATITVHPDVYAKLTDTTNTEWNSILTDAAAKNISFATV